MARAFSRPLRQSLLSSSVPLSFLCSSARRAGIDGFEAPLGTEERETDRRRGERTLFRATTEAFLFFFREPRQKRKTMTAFVFFFSFILQKNLSLSLFLSQYSSSHAFSLASAPAAPDEPKSPRLAAKEDACDANAPSEAFIIREDEEAEEEGAS